jgi:hypothetical protein
MFLQEHRNRPAFQDELNPAGLNPAGVSRP